MKIFRSHSIQSIGALFLLVGMVFYFLKPVNKSSEEDAFTYWLQSHVKSGDNTNVIDQIQQLSKSDKQLESVIRKASSLVKSHAEDFKLPISSDASDENDVFQVLLTEWNAHQNAHSGMGEAVILKQSNPISVLPVDGISFSGKAVAQQLQFVQQAKVAVLQHAFQPIQNYQLIPLSGGIAIGAP